MKTVPKLIFTVFRIGDLRLCQLIYLSIGQWEKIEVSTIPSITAYVKNDMET